VVEHEKQFSRFGNHLRIDVDLIEPASLQMRVNVDCGRGSVRQSAAARRACCRTIGIASTGSPSESTRLPRLFMGLTLNMLRIWQVG
jgi:hypothetical protein